MRILGIDQGTSGTRALVLDEEGAVRGGAYAAHRQIRPTDGWVEHDAGEIWRNLVEVARRAAEQAGGRIDAVGLANQGETVLAWDRRTGEPLHHALVWQDTRAQAWMDELARDPAVAARVAVTTGLRLDGYFSAGKLRWLLDHVDGARDLAAAGRLCLSTLDAWLLWRLAGRALTDVSTAARTLLFDVRALRWDPWLLDLFGVPEEALPEVGPSVGRFGAAGAIGGGEIASTLADQPAAMVGEGCLAAGRTKATFGTGCFIYTNTGEDLRLASSPNDGGGLLATVAWQRDGRVTYALDGGVLAAGSVIAWLRDQLRLADSDGELDSLAAAGAPRGVVCVPALVGLGAPWWRRRTRAAWLGMGLATSRGDLVSAAYQGIACRVAQVVAAMSAAGSEIDRLRVDGGLTRSRPLMQAVADLTGMPVDISAEPEATAAGAAALAARGAGIWRDDLPIHGRVATSSTVEPLLSAQERAERLARFAAAVELIARFD